MDLPHRSTVSTVSPVVYNVSVEHGRNGGTKFGGLTQGVDVQPIL